MDELTEVRRDGGVRRFYLDDMPDQRLKDAMGEVKAVLAKWDIGAVVLLASTSHTEYLYHLTPSWSCAKVDEGGLRIRSQRVDYPSTEAQAEHLRVTAGLVAGLADAARVAALTLDSVIGHMGQHMDIEHRSWPEPSGGQERPPSTP